MQASSTAEDASPAAWLRRVSSVQQTNMTPDEVVRVRERASMQQRTVSLSKRSRTLERTSTLQMASLAWSPSIHSASGSTSQQTAERQQLAALSRIPSEGMDEGEDFEDALDSVQAALECQRAELAEAGSVALPPPVQRDAGEGLEASRLVGGVGGVGLAADMESALAQLRAEPTDDATRLQKFGIFEAYSEAVEKIRSETHRFWEAAKPSFADAQVRRAAEAELKRLDRAEAMGLPDDVFGGSVWYVQPMTRRAYENNCACNRALASLRTKLELLSAGGDCPICLDPLEEEEGTAGEGNARGTTTLPCCHKVCTACWQQWAAVRGPHGAFCPLCRHADFLDFVLSAGARG